MQKRPYAFSVLRTNCTLHFYKSVLCYFCYFTQNHRLLNKFSRRTFPKRSGHLDLNFCSSILISQEITTATKAPDILLKNMSFISPTETSHFAARSARDMTPEVEQITETLITFNVVAKAVACCIYKVEVD